MIVGKAEVAFTLTVSIPEMAALAEGLGLLIGSSCNYSTPEHKELAKKMYGALVGNNPDSSLELRGKS